MTNDKLLVKVKYFELWSLNLEEVIQFSLQVAVILDGPVYLARYQKKMSKNDIPVAVVQTW